MRSTRRWGFSNLLWRPGARLPSLALFPVLACSAGAFLLFACGSDASGPDPAVPTSLAVVEGMNLEAPPGTILPAGPTVEVRSQYADPMPGVTVTFEVLEGGGTTLVNNRTTDVQGRARVPWVLGPAVGTPQRMEASAGSVSVVIEASTNEVVPGERYYGRNQYIEYVAGDMPLVLSAPHGGDMQPAEIDDRTIGVTVTDRNTRDLALRIRDAIREKTGSYPHLVISHLHRSKLDPNREIVEAAQGDPEAERAWWEFQTFIHQAEVWVEEDFGEGLYIDLHGHGHEIQRLELGYLLSSADLAAPDELLSGPAFTGRSSFKALASKPGVDFAGLIRGPFGLGTLLGARGIPAVPSQDQPHPGSDPYFSGGYNTLVHGSRDGGTVSGVQIECNYTGIRDTDHNREAFAQLLSDVLTEFFSVWFGRDLGGSSEIPFGIVTETRSY